MMLSDILKIKKGITAIIGSGGKTTLMYRLAEELSKNSRVLITTTTQIYKPENIITLIEPSLEDIKAAFLNNNCVCIGKINEKGKLTKTDIPFEELMHRADYIIVEADGSKNLPLKAHAVFEPVIPLKTVEIILVLGIKGINRPINEVCHRAEIFCEAVGAGADELARAELTAQLINKEALGEVLVINQVETAEDMKNAVIIAENINMPVYAGEVMKGRLKCLR